MFSGYIQSAMIAGMNGRSGLAAWRWVFIFDGVSTIVIAGYGFVFFLDTPDRTKAFYLSAQEKTRCVVSIGPGMGHVDRRWRQEETRFSLDLFKRTVNTWQLYVLTILWCFWNTTVGKFANTVAQLFLSNDPDHKWSLYEVNNIPTSINGFKIIMVLFLNTYIDITGYRMKAVALNLTILLFGTICPVTWSIPLGLKIASYMFAGLDGPLSPIFYAWANILTTGDAQVRALTLAIMNSCGAALTTVIRQFLYPITDAPKFGKGFKASLSFLVGMCIWVIVVRVFVSRSK
ncbi:hypothetical protein EK21DRAFT_116843 [Setomelanomma holmii]|uniref:Uncharacterized protein n=1 Tax=Setomelanomma holmii TaxID=210430 RepID=A0A9P4LGB6_9PLEO|nr:hypothetical protein EK21DRAFT_116843 [Setomelanomma holmii]